MNATVDEQLAEALEELARYDEWLRDRINSHEAAEDEIRRLRAELADARAETARIRRATKFSAIAWDAR